MNLIHRNAAGGDNRLFQRPRALDRQTPIFQPAPETFPLCGLNFDSFQIRGPISSPDENGDKPLRKEMGQDVGDLFPMMSGQFSAQARSSRLPRQGGFEVDGEFHFLSADLVHRIAAQGQDNRARYPKMCKEHLAEFRPNLLPSSPQGYSYVLQRQPLEVPPKGFFNFQRDQGWADGLEGMAEFFGYPVPFTGGTGLGIRSPTGGQDDPSSIKNTRIRPHAHRPASIDHNVPPGGMDQDAYAMGGDKIPQDPDNILRPLGGGEDPSSSFLD